MTTLNLVDAAIQKANGDTIGTEEDAYLRQCCGNVWTMIRDRLEAGGHSLAAALVQEWCEPEWVKESRRTKGRGAADEKA
jgi:hypothetical protein